ncbi:MAG: DUF4468 domain-containing protein [Flavobacteriales bacterium]|nr:DUF4468 domain-containing protein [Flavobacteriales bacterium]
MLKNTFLLMSLAMLSMSAMAQKTKLPPYPPMPVSKETKLITYEGVGKVDGKSSGELYDRAFEWVKTYYKNPMEKLRRQERDNGEMEVFARFPIFAYDKKGEKTSSQSGLIQYTLTLQFKDGRYKYVITDLNMKATSNPPIDGWLTDKENDPNADNHVYQLIDIDTELNALIKDMTHKIAAKADKAGDDW